MGARIQRGICLNRLNQKEIRTIAEGSGGPAVCRPGGVAARAGVEELPDFSDEGLMAELDAWLGPQLAGVRRAEQLAGLDLLAALQARLGWAARESVDRLAPAAITAGGLLTATDGAGPVPRPAPAHGPGRLRPDPEPGG
jgi:hypothetical protein